MKCNKCGEEVEEYFIVEKAVLCELCFRRKDLERWQQPSEEELMENIKNIGEGKEYLLTLPLAVIKNNKPYEYQKAVLRARLNTDESREKRREYQRGYYKKNREKYNKNYKPTKKAIRTKFIYSKATQIIMKRHKEEFDELRKQLREEMEAQDEKDN